MINRYSIIVRNTRVAGETEPVDVGVVGNRIRRIAPKISENADKEFDADGKLAISGFVDCHMHLDKALLAKTRPNRSGTLEEAIEIMRDVKRGFTQRDVESRALSVARMALANGTVAIRTHVDVDPNVGLTSIAAMAEVKKKLAGILTVQIVAFPQEGLTSIPGSQDLLRKALDSGADLVGGIPAIDPKPTKHIDEIFKIAKEFDVDIDMHIDETDDPRILTLEYLVEKTIKEEYRGRVTADHCCSLSAVDDETATRVVQKVRKASLNIVTLPSTNLYLQGRKDHHPVRRGITRVKELLDAGVNVSCASDNIRDPFNPFGNADMLQLALLLAHAAHMGGRDELATVFKMATENPAEVLGISHRISEDAVANIVLLDAETPQDAITIQARKILVISQGNVILHAQK